MKHTSAKLRESLFIPLLRDRFHLDITAEHYHKLRHLPSSQQNTKLAFNLLPVAEPPPVSVDPAIYAKAYPLLAS